MAVFLFSSGYCTEFNRGGVTFPLEEISHSRFSQNKNTGINLIENADFSTPFVKSAQRGWSYSNWLSGAVRTDRERLSHEIGKQVSVKILNGDLGNILEIQRSSELEKILGKNTLASRVSVRQVVHLPDEEGGNYSLRLNARNQIIGGERFSQMILVNCFDDSNAQPRNCKPLGRPLCIQIGKSPHWIPVDKEINVPKGTRYLEIMILAEGCGILQIKEVSLVKSIQEEKDLSVELFPAKLLDNNFVLAKASPCNIAFRFRNNKLFSGDMTVRKILMHLELPSEVHVIGTNSLLGEEIESTDFLIGKQTWKRWSFNVDSSLLAIINRSEGFVDWYLATLLIVGDLPEKTIWNACRYYLIEAGKPVSEINSFTLSIVPSLPKIDSPKQFYTGFNSIYRDIIFRQTRAKQAFAKLAGNTGSNFIVSRISPEYGKMLRENGIRLLTTDCYGFGNGFLVGGMPEKLKPDYAKYRDATGMPLTTHGIQATCPIAVYKRTPYYQDYVLPQLKNSLIGRDGFQPNWEPYMFRGKGCFCDLCREEFAKFAGLSSEKVKRIWPAQLQPGLPYHEQAIRFRSYQHGLLVKTLHEDCVRLGAKEVGFCPEIGTDQIVRYPDYFKDQGEFSPYEYAGKLKWLNVWGPYVWFHANQPYVYSKGANLITWETAKRVVQDYQKVFPDPAKRARLQAMPHACQSIALAQPEGIAMDQISSFLAGYDASILYFFPRGYDHRFWKAFADSNALIAANEDIVLNGEKKDDVTVTPQTPFPAPVENIEPKFLPDVRKSDLLQVAAFEKDGQILVAVGNFWEKGDVVFRLRVPGLKSDQEYTVQEKAFRRQFVPEQGKFFTGKILADGILLHAGGMRWAFFEIAAAAKLPAEAVTSAEMRRELERCKKENRRAAEEEAARDKALHMENDIGELKSMSSGVLFCKPVTKNGKPMLEVVSGKNALLLNPCGMALESWTVDGTDQCSANFGHSAFWTPGKNGMVVNNNYRITEQKISAEGLQVTAEFTTTVRSYPQLSGLKIIKTVFLSSDLKQVAFEVRLNNTQTVAMNDVGYRWSFIPAAWNNLNRGTVENNGRKFQRPNTYTLLNTNCDPASEQIMRRLFKVKSPTLQIKGNLFRFAIPGKSVMQATFLPAEQFAGVAVWDTANMLAATFEPFYNPVMIPPGDTVAFESRFKVMD